MSSEFSPGGRYRIVNTKSGTSLDLDNQGHRFVNGWNFTGGEHQLWQLEQVNDSWAFRNYATGKYLAVEEKKDGAKVIGQDERFEWHAYKDEKNNSVHRVFVPNTRLVIDLSNNGDATGGTPVEIWGSVPESTHQTWKFERMD